MTRAANPPASAPSDPIRRALRRVDLRLRAASAARGLGMASAVAAVAAAAGMGADFALGLPDPARWAVWGLTVAAVGLIAAAMVVRPWIRKARWFDLAALVERADPSLAERLTGSIALIGRGGRPGESPALVAALVDDAAEQAKLARPMPKVGGRRALGRLAAGMALLAIVAAPAMARPDPFRTLALRTLAPWLDLERVGRLAIVVEPGDRTVAIGSDPRIEATVSPRFGSTSAEAAWLEWTDGSGQARRARMTVRPTEGPARSFEIILPRLAGSIDYRVVADSARSRRFRIEAVERPRVAKLSAWVEPPSYTGLAAGSAPDPDRIEVVEGSHIALHAESSKCVEGVDLIWPVAPPAVAAPIAMRTHCVTALQSVEAVASGTYILTPRRDHDGLDGKPEERRIVVKPDAPPTLVLQAPPDSSEARPDDRLQLGVTARDDFAVASAELHYEVRRKRTSGGDPKPEPIALTLAGSGSKLAKGTATLPLRSLDLADGDAVSYRVRILDNRPGPKGPNEAWSPARGLLIVAKAEPMLARRDRARREALQARLEEIRKAHSANRREVEQLRYAADAARRDPAAWGLGRDAALANREADARGVVDRLQLLAREAEADPTFAPLARPARQAADVEGEAGRLSLEQARQAGDPAKRLGELRQADNRLGALQNRLDELRRKLDALAKLDADRQELRDLAAKEDDLADRADRPGADRGKLATDQDEVRRKLDALVAKSPGLRAEALAAQAEEAADLARKARELADRQRAEARATTSAARVDGPARDLAEAQRALEDEARRLALEVDDPLAENGRARVDVDALRRAAETIARGDMVEGVRRLEEAEDATRRLARDVEDVPNDPRALARRLARRQDALAGDVNAVVAESRRDDLPPDRKAAALPARLAPMLAREEAIGGLAAGIAPPSNQANLTREAVDAVARASANLRDPKPREAVDAQESARRALHRLADALPDPHHVRDEARRKLDEARRREEDVARDVDRLLSETAPRPDKPDADARAAADLADRLAPLVPRQREAAAGLAAPDVESRIRPQRDRAASKAGRLLDAIEAVRAQAPPKRPDSKPKPPARWHVAGPFPGIAARPTFDPAAPVDLESPLTGPDGKPRDWKPAPIQGESGLVDLAPIFGRPDNQSAFAVAVVSSPTRRRARLAIGSDDTLVVWLNGRQVFEFNGSRSCNPGQDGVDVDLIEGVNRLALRCGNGNGDWQFAIGLTPPPPEGFDPSRARALRESLVAAKSEAITAARRLEQKTQGKLPADDLAAELAAEQRSAAELAAQAASKPPEDDPTPRDQAAVDRRRLASALRNLEAPEAAKLQAEAVRLADEAAKLDASAEPKAIAAATKAAAEAGAALARRLLDEATPRAETAAPPPVDPEFGLGPDQAAKAADLARRQRRLRERLQATIADRSAPQAEVRRDATALARSMADLRDRAKEVNARNQGQAQAAADLLGEQAPRAMDRSAEQLNRGQLDGARDARRQAADLLERAAREAEDLANGLRAEGAADGATPPANAATKAPAAGLGEARSMLRELAGRLGKTQDARGEPSAAAPAMRQAAESLRVAARTPGDGPPSPPGSETDPDNPDPVAGPSGVAEPDLAALQALVREKTGRRWGELPGHLRTEILQQSKGRYRDDYARLIQLYFREIAADAARPAKP